MLFVSARPKLGDRQVKLTHVTEWIEKKLKQEFRVSQVFEKCMQKVVVTIPRLKLNRLKPLHMNQVNGIAHQKSLYLSG